MKYSKQRELILTTVRKNLIHPTADQVYSIIRKTMPNISLGTVYRNLNLLAENGDIIKISLPNQSDRFDGTLEPHYHMICNKCNKVFDIKLDNLKGLSDDIFKNYQFSVENFDLIINGTCCECKQSQ